MPGNIGFALFLADRGAPMFGVGSGVAAGVTVSTAVSADLLASASISAGLGGSISPCPFAGGGASTGFNGAAGASVAPDARNERLPLLSMILALSLRRGTSRAAQPGG